LFTPAEGVKRRSTLGGSRWCTGARRGQVGFSGLDAAVQFGRHACGYSSSGCAASDEVLPIYRMNQREFFSITLYRFW
jgi:hypothetical protein